MRSKLVSPLDVGAHARVCGCVSLRAGSVLAGILVILYSVLSLAPILAALTVPSPAPAVSGPAGEAPHVAGLVAAAVLHMLAALLSALMIVGVFREVVWLLRPWLVLMVLQLCAGALALLLPLVTGAASGGPHQLALQCLLILVRLYMVTVVGSYCRQLEGGAAERQRLAAGVGDAGYTEV